MKQWGQCQKIIFEKLLKMHFKKSISSREFLNRLENPQDDFCILDVRSKNEINEFSLDDPRVRYIEMQNIPDQMKSLSKEKDILVLCLSGARSWQVVQFLTAHGFTSQNIDGGLQEVLFLKNLQF